MTDVPRSVVLDASAVLALLLDEPGASVVRDCVQDGIIGAVNLAEVLAKLIDLGVPGPDATEAVGILGLQVAPMSEGQAQRSAMMRAATRAAGLSLGDRACLALAAELDWPAVTADRSWAKVADAVKVAVQTIR